MITADKVIETVELIPDYANLTKMFLSDFEMQGSAMQNLDVENHTTIHSLLASLNVAAQALDSAQALDNFRNTLARVVEDSRRRLDQKRAKADEMADCTCDYPSTLGGHHFYCRLFECRETDEEPPIDEPHGDALAPGAHYADGEDGY